MPDATNKTIPNSPKDPVIGKVKTPPAPSDGSGTEAEEPAGQRNAATRGNDGEHADHATEEAAAYRENDA